MKTTNVITLRYNCEFCDFGSAKKRDVTEHEARHVKIERLGKRIIVEFGREASYGHGDTGYEEWTEVCLVIKSDIEALEVLVEKGNGARVWIDINQVVDKEIPHDMIAPNPNDYEYYLKHPDMFKRGFPMFFKVYYKTMKAEFETTKVINGNYSSRFTEGYNKDDGFVHFAVKGRDSG